MSTVFWKKLWKFQNFYTLHKKNPKILKTFVQLYETPKNFSTFCIKKSCFFCAFLPLANCTFFSTFFKAFCSGCSTLIFSILHKNFQHFRRILCKKHNTGLLLGKLYKNFQHFWRVFSTLHNKNSVLWTLHKTRQIFLKKMYKLHIFAKLHNFRPIVLCILYTFAKLHNFRLLELCILYTFVHTA